MSLNWRQKQGNDNEQGLVLSMQNTLNIFQQNCFTEANVFLCLL